MASKKYSFLLGILCLLATYGFSQEAGGGYSASDSSIVPDKRMPQHTEFLNGTYNFPAKPRNQWEIGIKGGMFNISGDVSTKFDGGFGVHVRKAMGYVFSMRLEYMYANAKGLNWRPSGNYSSNDPWIAAGYTGDIYYNYKTNIQDLSLEGLITLNNIRFHKAKTGFNLYGIFGIGGMIYDAKVNALNGSTPYNFSGVSGGVYENRKDTKNAIKDLLDDSYESSAENHGDTRPKLFGSTFKPVGHVGAGVAFKLNNRFNLALEDRFSITKDDLLDGQRWSEQSSSPTTPVLTQDYDTYNFLSLGLNYNIGSKSIEPLWWVNPLDYAYSEIRNPRLMRLPKPVLPDADGDGVTDQFDLEQTPQGVPVDSHGVSRDTDGDGVPDARDKELVTPTVCQPVDADGVGKCPCPEGCGRIDSNACATALGALPSVTFTGNSVRLTEDAKSLLASVASRLRNNPECRIVVVGYCASTKSEQQRSWDRVNAVINHLVEKEGISGDRLIFQYGMEGGDCNTVDLRAAASGEQGPNNVPAPHPNLRKQ
ncbi:OmpA family protein [Chitinophagaceae bacterium LB-8]|uniref:OmpA family protein n=1 Tax=Paraflavisolibacter caeni TaxID=2982496 RepID=A0A9X2XSY9_9BACT|nr:OmpA family protein [Paraflavisolibacter caeni]MCU7548381.1 OmpA family protein [Paraflavisolibacter caeni]